MTANEVLKPVEALAGNRETNGGNNTLVNSHYGAPGQAYCGYTVRYGFEMSGNSAAIASCPSVIWVPSFRAWAAEHWERVDNAQAQKGDVMFYRTQHTGFIYSPYDGRTVITLEGNADVYATADEARASTTGSGAFEGIGYKKRYLSDDFRIYRPPYSAQNASQSVRKVGVDVSEWNKDIDWKTAKASGIEFAIIRIGYGDTYREGIFHIDKYADANIRGTREAGIPVGYYFFSYAGTAEEAVREADFFVDYVEKHGTKPTYPLAFDYEYHSEEKSPPQESRVTIARAFMNRVKERGYPVLNYSNYDYLNYRGFGELVGEFGLWYARWGVSDPGRDCDIWQYTSTGRPDGFAGNVDMNICYKDYGGDTPAPDPTPTPTPTEDKCMVQTNIIKKGSKGSTVQSWQMLLNGWGYSCGNADGIFGAKTEEQTKKFQKEYGLDPDGVVGSATWGMMLA